MFCQNCGSKIDDDAKFCPNCGADVRTNGDKPRNDGTANGSAGTDSTLFGCYNENLYSNNDNPGSNSSDSNDCSSNSSVPRQIQLTYKNCHGTMTVDENKEVITCPFCGSKELIIDSDTVAAEKIKSQAYKDVEFRKLEHEKEKALREEEKKEEETYKKSKLAKWSIFFAIASCIICVVCFSNRYIVTGIITAVQTLIFITSWLLGRRIIQAHRKGLHIILFLIGMLLIVADIFTKDMRYYPSYHSNSGSYSSADSNYNTVQKEDNTYTNKTSESQKGEASDSLVDDSTDEVTPAATESAEEPAAAASSGIRPEFQEAMDAYENFMNEYCDFLVRYSASDDVASMLTDYMNYLSEYEKAVEKFDAVGEEDMSDEEYILYIEVSNRVAQKLIEAGSSM